MNLVSSNNFLQDSVQIKKTDLQQNFSGTSVMDTEEKKEVVDLGVKVGLAIAAAVGIGLAIKNGKAAKVAQETAEKLQTKVDDAQKMLVNLQKKSRIDEVKIWMEKSGTVFADKDIVYENGVVKLSFSEENLAFEFDDNNRINKIIGNIVEGGKNETFALEGDSLKVYKIMLPKMKEFVDGNPDFSSIASWLHCNGIKKEQFASYCNALGEYGSGLKKILDYFPPYKR